MRIRPLFPSLLWVLFLVSRCFAQETHDHGTPEKLGTVSFAVSCSATVQDGFNRGVALLHSFAYSAARNAFEELSSRDPHCAMTHWGVAMSYFHQLWDPPLAATAIPEIQREVALAAQIGGGS